MSNVTSQVPLFVTVGPPTNEPLSGTGLAFVEESYRERHTKGDICWRLAFLHANDSSIV